MSVQTGTSINKTAFAFIDSVIDRLVISIPNPNAERQIIIHQISYGRIEAAIVPPAGALAVSYTGVYIFQNGSYNAPLNYSAKSPIATAPQAGEMKFFDNTPFVGGKTINFIPKPLEIDPATDAYIVLTIDAITTSADIWLTVLGDYVPVKKNSRIGQFELR